MLDDRRLIAWCALAGAVAFPVAPVIVLPGMGVLGSDPGPFSAPVLTLFAFWGALAGGGLGLGLGDRVRSPAMAAQGAVGFMAAWAVGWATWESVFGLVLVGAVVGVVLGIGYGAWAPVVGMASAAGFGLGYALVAATGDVFDTRPWAGWAFALLAFAFWGAITGMAVGEGDLGRRQGKWWAAWSLPAWHPQVPIRLVGALLAVLAPVQGAVAAVRVMRSPLLCYDREEVPAGVAAAIFTGVGRPLTAAVADLDGDGDRDLARSAGVNPVLENSGGGQPTLALGGADPVIRNPTAPAMVADFDGDGDQDLAVVGGERGRSGVAVIGINDGRGTFETRQRVPLGAGPGPVDAAQGDLDGDGLPDLVVLERDGPSVLWNDGGSVRPGERLTGLEGAWRVVVADIDGDRRADVVAMRLPGPGTDRTARPAVVLYRNVGERRFSTPTPLLPPTGYLSAMSVADFDADGRLDVAVTDGEEVRLYRNRGAGAFESALTLAGGGEVVTAVELDGDGRLDLVAFQGPGGEDDHDGELRVWLNHGGGGFSAPQLISRSATLQAAGDLDGDGRVDFLGEQVVLLSSSC